MSLKNVLKELGIPELNPWATFFEKVADLYTEINRDKSLWFISKNDLYDGPYEAKTRHALAALINREHYFATGMKWAVWFVGKYAIPPQD